MNWRNRNVFVTGGNGFLGSYVVRMLVEAGAQVTCLIREAISGSRFHLEGWDRTERVTCVFGDLADFYLLRGVLEDQKVDTVFHLAAMPIVGEAIKNPLPAFNANVPGTCHVLEAARQYGKLRSLCAITSDKAYGESDRLPYQESDPLRGLAPYDASKVCADVLLQSYARTYGLPVGIMRAGNFYGPGDSQWSRVVPGTIKTLLAGERPVIRSSGRLLRDYLYIEDAARGALLLAEALTDRPALSGEAFNFGTGTPTSVLDLVKMLIARSGKNVDPIVEGGGAYEISAQYLDSTKAKEVLGWHAEVALPEGIDRTWGWYEEFLRSKES